MKRILTFVCLTIVLYSCKIGSTSSPKNTVASFIAAAREGNIAELKKYITKSDAGLLDIAEGFLANADPAKAKEMKDKMAAQFKDKAKNARIEIKDEKIDGDNATVNVEFDNEGKTETRPFSLVKEDGQWKISLISTGMKNSGSDMGDMKDMQEVMKTMSMDSLQGAISQGLED